jgi:hypothetical protein
MRLRMAARLVRGVLIAIAATGLTVSVQAQDKVQDIVQDKRIKIGVILYRYVVDDKSPVVWPKSQAQREAVLSLQKGTAYSNQ